MLDESAATLCCDASGEKECWSNLMLLLSMLDWIGDSLTVENELLCWEFNTVLIILEACNDKLSRITELEATLGVMTLDAVLSNDDSLLDSKMTV